MRGLIGLAALAAVACEDETSEPELPDTAVAADVGFAPEDSGQLPADTGLEPDDAGFQADLGFPEDAGFAADASEGDGGTTARTDIETLSIGTVLLGADGRSGPLTFRLPNDAVSFTISVEGPLTGTYIVRTLSGPTGVLVSDDDSGLTPLEQFLFGPWGAQFVSPNRVVQHRGAMAALFPNNPGVSVAGGEYTMELEGVTLQGNSTTPYSGPVEATIHYRRFAPADGRIDVSLYFTGAQSITSSTAPTDTLIQQALTELGNIYQQTRLRVGTVRYYDIDASFQTISGFIDGSSTQLEELFMLTEGRGPGLHFFFVDRFEGGFGGSVAGIAGGVPGPPLNPGSAGGGVAVALSAAAGDSQVLAHVMAHEGGHWLGLFHTSEIIGTSDQIPDTPDGQAGNTFLMFPAVGGGTQVSANQATVVRSHIEVVAE